MSRVAITDLVTGNVALSAAVNATLASWVAALALAALGANNVRPEGIDRRTLSGAARAVYSAGQGATPFYASGTSSGAVTNAAPPYIVVNCGGAVQTGDTAPAVGDLLTIRAATHFTSESTSAVNQTLVDLVIEWSTDSGATWNTQAGTRQRFQARAVPGSPAHITGTALLIASFPSAGVTSRYRLSFIATPGNVTFYNASIYVEDYAK